MSQWSSQNILGVFDLLIKFSCCGSFALREQNSILPLLPPVLGFRDGSSIPVVLQDVSPKIFSLSGSSCHDPSGGMEQGEIDKNSIWNISFKKNFRWRSLQGLPLPSLWPSWSVLIFFDSSYLFCIWPFVMRHWHLFGVELNDGLFTCW